MSSHDGGNFSQEFRVLSASSMPIHNNTILVGSRFDKKSGERIVLWKEIQTMIENADRIQKDNRLVPFMMDGDFEELVPLRILYEHGVILDVIVKSQAQKPSTIPKTSVTSRALVQGSSQSTLNTRTRNQYRPTSRGSTGIGSVVQHVGTLSIATSNAIEKSLVRQSTLLDMEEERSLQQNGEPDQRQWGTHTQPPTSLQVTSRKRKVQPVDDYIKEGLKKMKVVKVVGVQEDDLFQMRTLDMLQQILEKQQQTLNHQAVHDNRMQALMTQNYELHEYPIPRLFIVLPKPRKRKDKFTHPLSKQFQLHFLCECGENTIHTGRGSFPNKIHLARHEGYDIDQPNEFFKKYGSYVLAVLKFFKYGAMAAGVAIPPLALFKVADGLDSMQKSLTSIMSNTGSLMDETIKHIQGLQGDMENGSDTSGHMRMEDIEALEGADLRQLQLYLNDKDKGRALGNLFRTFTPDGHVKWVCIDHYEENYRKVAMQRFKDVIDANNGHFYAEGYVRIDLGSRIVAKQFYEAMIKARGVKRLLVDLQWDLTFDDFGTFASAVTTANISSLELIGDSLKEPIMDIINNGRRYNPILDLMCNRRIEEMELRGFPNFYKRINKPHFKAVFMKLLRNCPFLVELNMIVSDLTETFEDLKEDVVTLPRLEKMTMEETQIMDYDQRNSIEIGISHGKMSSVQADLCFDNDLCSGYPFIRGGYLTELRIDKPFESTSPSKLSASQVADVIYMNPVLGNLTYTGPMDQPQIMMDAITSAREKVISEKGAPRLLQITLDWDANGDSTTSCEFPECSATPTVSTIIRESYFRATSSTYDEWSIEIDAYFDGLRASLLQLWWSIDILETNGNFDDEMAADLDKSTEEKGSMISTLSLNPSSLTSAGLECMVRVIDRSHDLRQFNITFDGMYEEHQGKNVERLISRYGKRLNGLEIDGESKHLWIQKLATCCPSRLDLPQLDSLKIGYRFRSRWIPPGCARWIASMISSQLQQLDCDPAAESSRCEWSLSGIKHADIWLDLDPEEWEVVIRALDYPSLNDLTLVGKGLGMDQFKLLVDCVPVNTNPVGKLRFMMSIEHRHKEYSSQVERLRTKVPNIDVKWLRL